jgi:diaminohydroxyphosphoribosylaminopyrimidine deaminase/5-amino-6-(5-phosphoribosylamino)uracil reductase
MTDASRSSDADRAFMQLAIEEMAKSKGNGPKVGVVLVKDGKPITFGHRMEKVHAERVAIEAAIAEGENLAGSTLFTTLEPCVSVGGTKEPCAELIARVGIGTVYIGRYDTHPLIYREGWKVLRDAGLRLRDFDGDFRIRLDEMNAKFAEHFVSGMGPRSGARFDYLLNQGKFEIQYSPTDERSIVTGWTISGGDSIWAYASTPVRVALARHAREFSEIDDPRALDFNYTVQIRVGEIAAFVQDTGVALVKVMEVHSGPTYGSDHTSVKIQYEIRTWT